jgi:hypothetical protein
MIRLGRVTVAAAAAVATVLAAGSAPANAQESCGALPNPIVVAGSSDLEPLLQQFAVKLATEPQPATIVVVSLGSQTKACSGIQSVVGSTDFGGAPGRYYTLSGDGTITPKSCTFPAGQTAHVAISEVFYESCPAVPQPKPADIADVLGPVQPIVFAVPRPRVTEYITYEEARAMFGCGVSELRPVAGVFNDATWVFCRDAAAGTQISLAKNLGILDSKFPACRFFNSDGKMLADFLPREGYAPTKGTVGFAAAGELGRNPQAVYLAFQAQGQTQAFYPDSRPEVADRRNVRDGHYQMWGYVHLIAKTNGGNLSPQASELIAWINTTKTSPSIDPFLIEAGAGVIPQCAMKVKRSSDGGLLSPYTPAQPCHCAFEAQSARLISPSCIPCVSASTCTGGLACRHGFCE